MKTVSKDEQKVTHNKLQLDFHGGGVKNCDLWIDLIFVLFYILDLRFYLVIFSLCL